MKYDYQISPHKKKKYLKKVYFFIIFIFVFFALGAAAIRVDSYIQNKKNTPDQTTTEKTTAYFASSTKIFRTQYFQFQAQNNWTEIPAESTDNKFVYRGQNKSLIEEELVVYVDDIPDNLAATRILPVSLSDEGHMIPSEVTDHCNESVGGFKSNDKIIMYKKVKVNCDIDNTQYNVLIGLSGGTTEINLIRPDSTKTKYTLYYRNVKAVPDASGLIDIVKSFQAR